MSVLPVGEKSACNLRRSLLSRVRHGPHRRVRRKNRPSLNYRDTRLLQTTYVPTAGNKLLRQVKHHYRKKLFYYIIIVYFSLAGRRGGAAFSRQNKSRNHFRCRCDLFACS
ncbi:hypothetical protein CEXT_82161 [Caerostris extrusa]|uniref:Uncharacterized protein n=1 Tax=Caerostris extrusa TaxID=172846 RepID=A0AAV4QHA6_CAEEX|nr:hypothetical protein CEXT_82161 [Caerostris extrusa]